MTTHSMALEDGAEVRAPDAWAVCEPAPPRPVVLYIVGEGRSGSTLVDRILGTLPGASSHNEICGVWEHGFARNEDCSCGRAFRSCPFWQAVAERAFGGFGGVDGARVAALQRRVHRSRYFLQLDGRLRSRRFDRDLREYRRLVRRLYLAIASASGARVVVDSSKLPGEALVLAGIPELDVRIVHLVRDVRGCVRSWKRKKVDAGFGELARHSTTRAAVYWCARQILSETLRKRLPYARVRYEDLMREPRRAFRDLAAELGLDTTDFHAFCGPRAVDLPPVHGMLGNPHRFRTGETELRLDAAWGEELSVPARLWATALALPLLLRYGYVP